MKRLLPVTLLILALTLAACQGLSNEPQVVATVPPESSTSSVEVAQVSPAAGQPIWEENCERCHGANSLGADDGAPLPDLSLKSDEELLATIATGITDKMPAFAETLSPEDRTAVLTYARMLQSAHSGASSASAETDIEEIIGTVTGQITNGTVGSPVPPNLTITLSQLDAQGLVNSVETAADASGAFTFTDVPLRTDRSYLVDTTYNGFSFTSALTQTVAGADQLTLPVTVYEPGAETSAVAIDRMTQHIGVQDGELQVVQLIRFTNSSDRVFFTAAEPQRTSVSVQVPQGAAYNDMMGGGYQISGDGTRVSETHPLIPGQPVTMHVVFVMPYTGTTSFQQTWDYPIAGQVEVLLGTDGLSLAAPALENRGPRTIGDTIFLTYGADVQQAAGQQLSYEVSGSPVVRQTTAAQTAAAPSVSPFAYIFIALGIGALVITGALFIRERRSSGILNDTNTLIAQIADLDAKYQQGTLEKSVYEKRRAALKAQLASMLNSGSQA